MELVKIDPKEYGIEESKAKEISAQFKPMLDMMVALEEEYNEVIKLPLEDEMTSKKARELRLKYVKVRTGTASIHKEQKAFYLQAGRFVDGWRNAQLFASSGIEERLEAIEKYQEIIEAQIKHELELKRIELLEPYVAEAKTMGLGSWSEDVFETYLNSKKQAAIEFEKAKKLAEEKRIADEKEAEKKRIEKEKADAKKREEERKELARLKDEADKREKQILLERKQMEEIKKREEERSKELQPYIIFIRDYKGLISKEEKEYRKELADIKKGAEDHWELERKEQIKRQKEQDKRDMEILKQLEEKTKLQNELEAKRKAEIKHREKLDAEILKQKKEAERLAKAPIKEQMTLWINGLTVGTPPELNDTAKDIIERFESFKNWARKEINNL